MAKDPDRLQKAWDALAKKHGEPPNAGCDGWKRFTEKKGIEISVRCQASMPHGKGKDQCRTQAVKGHWTCIRHGGGHARAMETRNKIAEQTLGIYTTDAKRLLSKEMAEIAEAPAEKMGNVNDELRLSVALMKRYLSAADEAEVTRSPGKLFSLIDAVVRTKRVHWEMMHAKETSFTREQVAYMLTSFRSVVLAEVRDQDTLRRINEGLARVTANLRQDGFGKN